MRSLIYQLSASAKDSALPNLPYQYFSVYYTHLPTLYRIKLFLKLHFSDKDGITLFSRSAL